MPKVVAGYKEEARKTILDTATEVFAEKGFQGATMDDVAKKLGVSKGAVYQYFSSKDELFQALCGMAATKLEHMLRTSFEGGDLRKSADKAIEVELDRMAKRQMLMFEALAEAPRNPTLNKVMKANYDACVEVISDFLDARKEEGKLKKDLDTVEAARALIALRHGVLASVLQGLSWQEAKKVWMDGFDAVLRNSMI